MKITSAILDEENSFSFLLGSFIGLDSIKGLHLYNNQLTTITRGTFANLVTLSEIQLNENPIHSLEIGIIIPISSSKMRNKIAFQVRLQTFPP